MQHLHCKKFFSLIAVNLARVLTLLACSPAVLAFAPITQFTHSSGAGVWLMPSPALPMVDVQIEFDGGRRRDGDKPGLADLASQTLPLAVLALSHAGSSATSEALPARSEQALSERWADLGAEFSLYASTDALVLRLRSLSEPAVLHAAADLSGQILAAPALPTAGWQRVQQQAIAAWKEAQTQPETLLDQHFAKAVFGPSAYGQHSSAASLAAVQLDDIRDYAQRVLQSCQARIAIVGDIGKTQAEKLVDRLMQGLQTRPCVAQPPLPDDVMPAPVAVAAAPVTAPVIVPLDSAQTHIAIGQKAVKRSDPDYLALLLGNHILGSGGFSSRLMAAVRLRRGLAYSVNSGFHAWLQAGQFMVELQTRNAQAQAAVRVVQRELQSFLKTGPSVTELSAAKANLAGGFVVNLDSNRELLAVLSSIARHRLPLDYLPNWTKQVEAISRLDILKAMRRVLQPERMAVVMVGQP